MSGERFKYWEECVAQAAEECGALLTSEQVVEIAGACEGAHENYGMAFHSPESPFPSEIKRLERELKTERSKVGCRECNGRGSITDNWGSSGRSSTSQCMKCRGEGKHVP